MQDDEIRRRLVEYRAEHHLDQKDLAVRLGVSQQTISNWESGKAIQSGKVSRILALLKVKATQTVEAPRPQTVEGLRERLDAPETSLAEAELRRALPDDLQGYMVETRVGLGGIGFAVDYASPTVVAEFKFGDQSFRPWLDQAVLSLAAIRTIHDQVLAPRDHYVVLLVGSAPSAGYRPTMNAAAILGVDVLFAQNAGEAAYLIAELEGLTSPR